MLYKHSSNDYVEIEKQNVKEFRGKTLVSTNFMSWQDKICSCVRLLAQREQSANQNIYDLLRRRNARVCNPVINVTYMHY